MVTHIVLKNCLTTPLVKVTLNVKVVIASSGRAETFAMVVWLEITLSLLILIKLNLRITAIKVLSGALTKTLVVVQKLIMVNIVITTISLASPVFAILFSKLAFHASMTINANLVFRVPKMVIVSL